METIMLFFAKVMTAITYFLYLIAPVVIFFGMIYCICHDLRCVTRRNKNRNQVQGTFCIHSRKSSSIVKIEEFSNTDPRDEKDGSGKEK